MAESISPLMSSGKTVGIASGVAAGGTGLWWVSQKLGSEPQAAIHLSRIARNGAMVGLVALDIELIRRLAFKPDNVGSGAIEGAVMGAGIGATVPLLSVLANTGYFKTPRQFAGNLVLWTTGVAVAGLIAGGAYGQLFGGKDGN